MADESFIEKGVGRNQALVATGTKTATTGGKRQKDVKIVKVASHKPLPANNSGYYGVLSSQEANHVDAATGKPRLYATKKKAKSVRDRFNTGFAGLMGFAPYAKPDAKNAMPQDLKAKVVKTTHHPKVDKDSTDDK